MKTILLLTALLITITSYSQPVLLGLSTESSPTTSMFLPMGATGRTVYKKITFGTLLNLEVIPRYTADTTGFKVGCGLNSSFQYVAKTSTHYLTPSKFSTLKLAENLYNADKLLDSGLYALSTKIALWDTGIVSTNVKMANTGNAAIGVNSMACNTSTVALNIGSSSFGRKSVSYYPYSIALSAGTYMTDAGANQTIEFVAAGDSKAGTADTIEILKTYPLTIPTDVIVGFDVTIVGVQTAGASGTIGNGFYQKWSGAIKSNAGTISFIGVPDSTTAKRSTGEITQITLGADDTNKQLNIICSGGASRDIEYTAYVKFIFMGYRNFTLGY